MQNSLSILGISAQELNSLQIFADSIEQFSQNDIDDYISTKRELVLLAHFAVENGNVKLLRHLKLKNFSLENNILISQKNYTPLALAINKNNFEVVKNLINLGVEVNDISVRREVLELPQKIPQDTLEIESVKNIFNLVSQSGFVFNNKNQRFSVPVEYRDLLDLINLKDSFLGDKKIFIDDKNQEFFQVFIESLKQCLKKYDDLDREVIRGERDVDKLGEIKINGLVISVNAYGLKKICDKIIIKKTPQRSIANCFLGVCQRVCDRIHNREIKLEDYLAKKDIPELQELKQNLKHLDECLKSTANISSYVSSASVSRANSMELRASQESRRLSRQSFNTATPLDIENSLIDPNRIDQNSIRLIEDRGLFLDSGDHQINPSTEAESFSDRNIFEENLKKNPEAESPNSKSIHRQSLRVNRGGNCQSMQDISRDEKLESEIISNQRVLTRQNEIPNSLNSNISRIGLAPIATRLAPIRRSQSLS